MTDQTKDLSDLLKEKWIPISAIGENQILLGKNGERISYDITKKEVVCSYQTQMEIKEQ